MQRPSPAAWPTTPRVKGKAVLPYLWMLVGSLAFASMGMLVHELGAGEDDGRILPHVAGHIPGDAAAGQQHEAADQQRA